MSMELSEFRAIAKKYNVIPVWRKVFADNETPLTLYKICFHNPIYLRN